jgi:hypothetical protein
VCVDIAQSPSCADAQSVDPSNTSTTEASTASGSGSGSGNAADPPAQDPTAVLASSPASSRGGKGSDPTLPFTGAAVALLTIIGATLFGSGSLATRLAHRRRARDGA